ncbi:hypothetical protein [Limnoglobus roseus]|uniref:Uncharacterized protein n=1 Tax=Limnoglobus roseus TaxID=2598579 RepID=A0A5C1AFW9_9BACT|nr:hypothetical protein [Limnoglobus roseus]QEL15878.1 hypothetical protein PX52LOC_02814 [Limnoglobus roseus]
MGRRLSAVGLVLIALSGCETAGKAERDDRRQRELVEVNHGLSVDRRVVPKTPRERDDPLLVDPSSLPEPERPRRP